MNASLSALKQMDPANRFASREAALYRTARHETLGYLLAGLLMLAPAALAERISPTTSAVARRLAWPPLPAPPRIHYVRDLREPQDIGERSSWLQRLGHWVTGEQGENVALRKPFGLAVDEQGNLCITDTDSKQLFYCEFEHKRWRHFDGAGKIHFSVPVAVARRHGIFYVADSGLGKVLALNDDGKLLWEVASPLRRPVGVVATDACVVVVDSQLHSVFVFDHKGTLKHQFGQRGVGPGEFNFPTHIALDHTGHLLVTDSLNCRVQCFDEQGKFVSQFGSNGDTSGHFSRPKGLAVDTAGHIYVADALFDNVQIFDPDGRLLLNIGQRGTGPGEFGLPAGLAISADNRLYVADSYNHRVQVFQYLGEP